MKGGRIAGRVCTAGSGGKGRAIVAALPGARAACPALLPPAAPASCNSQLHLVRGHTQRCRRRGLDVRHRLLIAHPDEAEAGAAGVARAAARGAWCCARGGGGAAKVREVMGTVPGVQRWERRGTGPHAPHVAGARRPLLAPSQRHEDLRRGQEQGAAAQHLQQAVLPLCSPVQPCWLTAS